PRYAEKLLLNSCAHLQDLPCVPGRVLGGLESSRALCRRRRQLAIEARPLCSSFERRAERQDSHVHRRCSDRAQELFRVPVSPAQACVRADTLVLSVCADQSHPVCSSFPGRLLKGEGPAAEGAQAGKLWQT